MKCVSTVVYYVFSIKPNIREVPADYHKLHWNKVWKRFIILCHFSHHLVASSIISRFRKVLNLF